MNELVAVTVPLLQADFPWLSLLLLLLPLGAGITLLMPAREARWTSLTTAIAAFAVSLWIVFQFDPQQSGFQFVERSPWIPSLHIEYLLGVDGLSLLLLPFTTLLFMAVIISSWNAMRFLPNLFFSLLLLFEACLIGIFSALDTALFFLCWELSLLPLFFLVSLWGAGPNRRHAAVKYTLFMMSGGAAILLAFIALAVQTPQGGGFDYTLLLQVVHQPNFQYETAIFFLLLFGFALKLPTVPFHAWLPVLAQEGPASVVATVVGLKVGVYGLIRFALPLAPSAAQDYQWLLVGMGMLSVLYGALAALSQTNLRRMLAYSSLSHVGLVVLGVASLTHAGIQGAIFQLLNFSLIASGLFLILAFVHQRLGSTEFLNLGGIASSMPLLASLFFFFGVASIGLPLTSGFPAEFLLIMGIAETHLGAGLLALVAMIITAAYFLSSYRQSFLGAVRHAAVAESVDLKPRELAALWLLGVPILVWGFYPQGLLNRLQTSSTDWLSHILMQQ